jgi:hypothetical protein
MKHWPSDRSTMHGSRFTGTLPRFQGLTWGNASRSIPRISRDQRQTAAVGCTLLRSVTSVGHTTNGHMPRSRLLFEVSGGRGIRTHEDASTP